MEKDVDELKKLRLEKKHLLTLFFNNYFFNVTDFFVSLVKEINGKVNFVKHH